MKQQYNKAAQTNFVNSVMWIKKVGNIPVTTLLEKKANPEIILCILKDPETGCLQHGLLSIRKVFWIL